MAVCDIEAAALGLNENERAIVDEKVKKAKELNAEKAKVDDVIERLKKEAETLRSSKIDKNELFKKDAALLEKSIKQLDDLLISGDPIEDAEKFEKLTDKIETLKERLGTKKAVNEGFKKSISDISKSLKDLRDYRRLLNQTARAAKNKLVDKIVNGDLKGARRQIKLEQFKNNPNSILDVMSQSTSKDSIYVKRLFYREELLRGTEPEFEETIKNNSENDLSAKETQSLLHKIKSNVLHEAESFGTEDDFLHPDGSKTHPVAMNQGILAQLFKNEAGETAFKNDLVNALGKDELEAMIERDYTRYYQERDIEGTIPTVEKALNEFIEQVHKGQYRTLTFNKLTFLSDEATIAFMKKYSGTSVVGNYASYAVKSASRLASIDTLGVNFPNDFILDKTIDNSKDKALAKLYRDNFYGNDYLHPSKTQRSLEKLSKVLGIIALSRTQSLLLSPFGDEMMNAVSHSVRTFKPGSVMDLATQAVTLFGHSIKSTLTLGAIKHSFSKNYLNYTDKFLRTFNEHAQYRFAASMGNGKGLSHYLVNYFENVDNGLRATSNKMWTTLCKDYGGHSLDSLASENERLHDLLTNKYGVDSDEWDTLRQYAKEHDMLDAQDFDSKSLRKKVVAMEYEARLSGVPNDYVVSLPGLRAFSNKYPVLTKAAGMFWNFFGKTMAYSWKNAMQYAPYKSKIGSAAYFFGMNAIASFVPNYMLSVVLGLSEGRNLEDIAKDPETYIDSALGVYGRISQIASALFNQEGAARLLTSSPAISTFYQFSKASMDTFKQASGINPDANAFYQWLKLVTDFVPAGHNTLPSNYLLSQVNPDAKPRKGEEYSWNS